jgi:hypothetical protein
MTPYQTTSRYIRKTWIFINILSGIHQGKTQHGTPKYGRNNNIKTNRDSSFSSFKATCSMTGVRSPLGTPTSLTSQRLQRKPDNSPHSTIVSKLSIYRVIPPFPHASLCIHDHAQSCLYHHKASVSDVQNWIIIVYDIQCRIADRIAKHKLLPEKLLITAEKHLTVEITFIHLVWTVLAPTRVYAYFTQ